MDHDLVAGLPAGDTLTDLPDHAGGVGAADVVSEPGVVPAAEDRNRRAESCPDVVEVDPCGHLPDDYLESAGLRSFDLLEAEGVLRFSLSLFANHPGGHLFGRLARLDVRLAHICEVYRHFAPLGIFKVAGHATPSRCLG